MAAQSTWPVGVLSEDAVPEIYDEIDPTETEPAVAHLRIVTQV
jgi:hypothetical protein